MGKWELPNWLENQSAFRLILLGILAALQISFFLLGCFIYFPIWDQLKEILPIERLNFVALVSWTLVCAIGTAIGILKSDEIIKNFFGVSLIVFWLKRSLYLHGFLAALLLLLLTANAAIITFILGTARKLKSFLQVYGF